MNYIKAFYKNEKNNLKFLFFWKLVILTFFFIAQKAFPLLAPPHYQFFDKSHLLSFLTHWDGFHYLQIAKEGVTSEITERNAFFPLFGYSISITAFLVRDYVFAGFVNNIIFSFLFIRYFFKFFGSFTKKENVRWALIMTLCFPTAFYTSMIYSEAMFLFLCFVFLYLYFVKKSRLSILYAFLLPIARGQGAFIGASIFIFFIYENFISKKKTDQNFKKVILNLLFFLLGYASLYLHSYLITGDPLAHLKAQIHFPFGMSISHLINPLHLIEHFFTKVSPIWSFNFDIVNKLFITFMFTSIPLVYWSKNKFWFIIYFLLAYCPAAMSLGGGSYARYSFIAFPFLAMSLVLLLENKRNWIKYICLVMITIQSILAVRFSSFLWVA